MLTALLRSKTPIGFLLSFILTAGMLLFGYFFGQPKGGPSDLLFTHWAFSWLDTTNGYIPFFCIVLAVGALLLARLRFREVKPVLAESNLSMVAMAAIMSVQARPLFTRPDAMAANLLVLGLFMLLLSTYKRESVLSEFFHVGLLLGFTALMVGQSILLIVSVSFAMLILRSGNWKEWFVLILGLIMALVFIALFLVWYDSPFPAFHRMVRTSWFSDLSPGHFTLGHLLLVFPILLSFSVGFRDLAAGTVHERNIMFVNLGWVVGVLLMVLFFGFGWQAGLLLTAFPLSAVISRNLESINRWWLADLLLILLIAAPFLRNLWQF